MSLPLTAVSIVPLGGMRIGCGGRPSSPGHLGRGRGLTRKLPRVERCRDLQQLRGNRSVG
jgi:hypothetical protein